MKISIEIVIPDDAAEFQQVAAQSRALTHSHNSDCEASFQLSSLFLTHLAATYLGVAQARTRRRCEPETASAAYDIAAAPSRKTGLSISRTV